MTLALGRLLGQDVLLVCALALEAVSSLLKTLPGSLIVLDFWHLIKTPHWIEHITPGGEIPLVCPNVTSFSAPTP